MKTLTEEFTIYEKIFNHPPMKSSIIKQYNKLAKEAAKVKGPFYPITSRIERATGELKFSESDEDHEIRKLLYEPLTKKS